ncbi:L-dopachrome tautomerase-related protein [Domibacillus iocasae]|uniref:L-dopachrome tautomerase-related protein n=1 Tax=Domibacillus iocasae TaxID=1714016 RepID=UPI00085935CE|nr:L-dopachrome tautomerase-related protein [Domibacillus iocasae]
MNQSDLNTNKMIQSINILNEVAPYRTFFLNNVVVNNKNNFVYIIDSGNGAIIIYNMKTKKFLLVLDRHYSTQDFPGFVFDIDNKPVFKDRPGPLK